MSAEKTRLPSRESGARLARGDSAEGYEASLMGVLRAGFGARFGLAVLSGPRRRPHPPVCPQGWACSGLGMRHARPCGRMSACRRARASGLATVQAWPRAGAQARENPPPHPPSWPYIFCVNYGRLRLRMR